jgi:hypothetical protein
MVRKGWRGGQGEAMRISPRYPRRSLLVAALLLCVSAPVAAQDASTASKAADAEVISAQVVSPEAQAVLDRMAAYLQSLPSFSIEAQASRDEVVAYGYKLQNNEHLTLTVQRPNRIRADIDGDIRNRSFLYDGSKFVMYSPDDQAFTSMPATHNLDKLIGGLLDAGVEMPLIDVIYESFHGTLADSVEGGVLVGESNINGVACDQLAFRQASVDWQLWIEKGSRPVPRKVVITTRYEVGDPQYQAVMTWNVQPKIEKTAFTFTPPKGVQEVSFVDAAAVQDGSQ